MLRNIFISIFLCSSLLASYPATATQTDALNSVCSLLGTTVEDAPTAWIQAGLERWEFADPFEDQRDTLMPFFEQAGLVDEVPPTQTQYDYVLVLGGLLSRMQQRFDYLCGLWEQGIRFNYIVFLAGDRTLRSDEISATGLTVESELSHWIYSNTTLPDGMEQAPAIFADTISSTTARATTFDTGNLFLAMQLAAGSCLAISNQPYVIYQNTTLQGILSGTYSVETVGAAIDSNPTVAIFLDTLGKILIQH